jgi:hypothetical protein
VTEGGGFALVAAYPPLSALPTSPPQGGRLDRTRRLLAAIFTSLLRGEIARNARVGVTATSSEYAAVTPPRTFGPTLHIKGRVEP